MIPLNKEQSKKKQKILIVDDSPLNRAILSDMLVSEYEVIEAENGEEGVEFLKELSKDHPDLSSVLSVVLLDIVMPVMDGFEMLEIMRERRWIEDIPVIMISSETDSEHVERAYDLGVTDFIGRPFDALIVRHRVVNAILLDAKQKKLVGMVADQIYEKEQRSGLMIDILSHIVEFRNGESGLHVLHVRTITEMLLERLAQKTSRYNLTPSAISMIGTASALHDIGKISVDEAILNKPGKLTPEEFDIMKQHTVIGADMLEGLSIHKDEPLVKVAYEICRWHHERYDGRGYPDGLKGDQIPISAQMVALADVYDALTSQRVYKPPFSHEKAVQMICDGQCGVFNPLVLECLMDISEQIHSEMSTEDPHHNSHREMQSVMQEMSRHEELTASERTLQLLEHERMKYSYFAAMTKEIQFEFTTSPAMVTLSAWGAKRLGLDEIVSDPLHSEQVHAVLDAEACRSLSDTLRSTSPDHPDIQFDCQMNYEGSLRWTHIVARAVWSSDEPPRYTGAIGKAIDIHDSRVQMANLERLASHDQLTGLLNHAYAKKRITERMTGRPSSTYALAIFDLDHFKSANDNYGHSFGDKVLIYLADLLRQSIRGGDIAARAGGDEFVIFLEYKEEVEAIIDRIFRSLCGQYEDFPISISMGVALTTELSQDYETLFHAADQALYTAKRSGRGRYCFYDENMSDTLTAVPRSDEDGQQQ